MWFLLGFEWRNRILIAKQSSYESMEKDILHESEPPANVRRFIASIDLVQNLIKFKPRTNLEAGIKLTVEWYEQTVMGYT